jgi:hypothetical protein
MLTSHGTECGVFFGTLVALYVFLSLLVPRPAFAEQTLLLFKDDSPKTTRWHETIRRNSEQAAVVSLNKNGDLMVKYGSVNVVLAYSAPEEPYTKKEVTRLAMAMGQEAPPVSGISISVNFTF